MYILSIDQGTTSSRAILFDQKGINVAQYQVELDLSYPQDGWVEADPEVIWESTLSCCRNVIAEVDCSLANISTLGISNQRETTILWDRATGQPIYPAIVWQDRRTSSQCQQLITNKAIVKEVQQKTGLLIDPYFSATKIQWLLDHVKGARERARAGELAFGTVDSFLLWRLTNGASHATDATNASRTLLFNINTQQWDDKLLELFDIPKSILPEVLDSAAHFGESNASILGAPISITALLGDQQAATVGQACFKPGMIKSTYGTGCFMLLNTGETKVTSEHRLLTTIAYRIDGQVTYGLEGSIFIAGAAVQWLRDALHFFSQAQESQRLAEQVDDTGGVYLVPAFAGLGAPYWDPEARGALIGLTRDTSIEHIVRAALEAACYQSRDLLLAMRLDYCSEIDTLRVDGGMAANNWLLQFLSDMLNITVERPNCIETSALGAAMMAGLGAGLYSSLDELAKQWQLDCRFKPSMPDAKRKTLYAGWQDAVQRILKRIT